MLVAEDERAVGFDQQEFHAEVVGVFLLPRGGYGRSAYERQVGAVRRLCPGTDI